MSNRQQHSVTLGTADVAQLRWDYKSIPMAGDSLTDIIHFDSLGAQGWELVQIVNGRAYFKRLGVHEVPA